MKKILFLLIVPVLFLAPLAANAQWTKAGSELSKVAGPTQLEGNLETSVSTVVKAALSLVGTIFLLLTVYAGILWMTAQGNEEKVTKAKDIIIAAVIGLVVVMAAYAITSFVTQKLTDTGGSTATEVPTCGDMNGTCQAACTDPLTEEVSAVCAQPTQKCCKTP